MNNNELKAKILELSEEYRDYTAEVLSKMVKVPGFSGAEKDRCELIVELCKEAGFDEVRIDGLGSVVGRVGYGPKVLAFDAHIDTVGIGDIKQWNKDPHSGEIVDGLVHGLGTSDQLGGAAAMIASGRMLKDLGYDGEFSVYYTFTVMEEDCDGIAWIYLIEKEGLKPDYIVSSEPSACKLYRGQRGRMEIEILIKGISSHGSIPHNGHSAAYLASKAALAIEKLNEELQPDAEKFLGKGSATVSLMEVYGPSQCSVPDEARLYIDRRLTWGENEEIAIGQVKDYISKAMGEEAQKVYMPYYDKKGYKGTDYGQELYFPTWIVEEKHEIVQGTVKAFDNLYGEKLVPGPCTYSTNAVSFCGRYHIPSVIIGPGDVDKCHKPNEFTRVQDLVVCSALYAMLPYTLK
ncbi:YgeY family selenium metabolism-linked hydrolase [Clostridium sediminicola]|uniref:YgeY family selenium metabolism-linked hydrolase n=1 Tax=Clostridium sediminicola TaxID=3114879 RepID=UPI0031F24340